MPLQSTASEHLRAFGFTVCCPIAAQGHLQTMMIDLTLTKDQYTGLVGNLIRACKVALVNLEALPGIEDGQLFAYVTYPPEGQEGKNLLAQILMVYETDEQGRKSLRIGLQEQYRLIDSWDYSYYWDAGR